VLRRRSLLGVSILGLLAGGLPLAAQPSPDEAAVREVVRKYVDARERADANAIAALFTSDADQLTSSGEWRKGREAIVKGTLASSKQNSGTRTIAIEAVRFPTADSAIADGRYAITGGAGGDRRMWTSFVLARTTADGKSTWQIAAIRNMLPATSQ
jgi:uncharacterized protein (TIGR02246 family)